jgi:hypothetical protein
VGASAPASRDRTGAVVAANNGRPPVLTRSSKEEMG